MRGFRNGVTGSVCDGGRGVFAFDLVRDIHGFGRRSKVVDSRDFGIVTSIRALQKLFHKLGGNIAQELPNRLILDY
jgi:hypothetical protein